MFALRARAGAAGLWRAPQAVRGFASLPVQRLPNSEVVVVRYEDVVNRADISDSIAEAFGSSGLGLITVSGVPQLKEFRQALLPLGHRFATLPEPIKQKYEHEESMYQFGWSHGKEAMSDGKPDFSKGSYYNNPTIDRPTEDPEIIKKWPTFCTPNIWPTEDVPEMEQAFKNLGKLTVGTGQQIAWHCDAFVRKVSPDYPENHLYKVIGESKVHKARLLHYFPVDSVDAAGEHDLDSWCGWHNDHGSLTCLVPAIFVNPEGKEVSSPDPAAGLYIRTRDGRTVQARFPADHLAFQVGETQQIQSGGILQATPHCVTAAQGENAKGIGRTTFAVFMEPMWDAAMQPPQSRTAEQVVEATTGRYLPKDVPALTKRWNPEMDFGEFTTATVSAYHQEALDQAKLKK